MQSKLVWFESDVGGCYCLCMNNRARSELRHSLPPKRRRVKRCRVASVPNHTSVISFPFGMSECDRVCTVVTLRVERSNIASDRCSGEALEY